MLHSFEKVDIQVDVTALKDNLVANPELFGNIVARMTPENSPHRESSDIWVRYNNIDTYSEADDMEHLHEPHNSVWYDVLNDIPEVLDTIREVFDKVQGETLGGVFITKLPPGKEIYPHIDGGWHAGYYEKYYVPIQNKKGATFNFEDGIIDPEIGEVYHFRNDVMHWVKNDTDADRIAMIVCIKLKDEEK